MKIEEITKGDILCSTDSRGTGYFRVDKVNRVTIDVTGENGNHVRAYPFIFERKVTYPVKAFSTSDVSRYSGDINDCRDFLRGFGMECTVQGWEGNGFRGILEFSKGEHHAAAWKAPA